MFGLPARRTAAPRVFASSNPMARRGPILPMDPAEQAILDQLRANRAALEEKSALHRAHAARLREQEEARG